MSAFFYCRIKKCWTNSMILVRVLVSSICLSIQMIRETMSSFTVSLLPCLCGAGDFCVY